MNGLLTRVPGGVARCALELEQLGPFKGNCMRVNHVE